MTTLRHLPFLYNAIKRGGDSWASTFISTWNTANTSAGSSNSNQVTLPLESTGTYDFDVIWGDGTADHINNYNDAEVTHTYSGAGTYTIAIDGTIEGWRFNNAGDKLKITNVSQWGNLIVGDNTRYFFGCSNMTVSATDELDVSGVTDMSHAFRDCSSMTSLVTTNWDVSNVTSFNTTFYQCSSLTTLDVSNWDVSSVTSFETAFSYCPFTTLDVSNWVLSSVTDMAYAFFSCTSLTTLDFSSWNMSSVTRIWRMLYNTDALSSSDYAPIKNWDVSSITSAGSFMRNSTNSLAPSDYDDVLVNWEAQAVQSNVTIHFNNSKYNPGQVDSGTTDGTTADKLIDSSQDFNTTVSVGDVVHNTTDDTYALVTVVNSDTRLTLSSDIMVSGENYTIEGSAAAKARARLVENEGWVITDSGPA